MSFTNTGFQPVKSTKTQRGQLRGAPSFETFSDLSDANWHGGRKDQRRQRMEVSRRKMLALLGR
ncbi:hypothetical protein [Scleromatobacter humisilvae]|uniref:Uncharacterized protein n=1 Tax=Scleromatobacter humisilvae TaxID=2897159 RepID=A0A9X1YJ57_9BURK|nr:hypothetical protein [Scleromatobacter humisilvae]MCK9687284.1 hypothetical protein [Scleromatobacter humisilvae]